MAGYESDAGRDVVCYDSVCLPSRKPVPVWVDIPTGSFVRERSGLAARGIKLLGFNRGWLYMMNFSEEKVELDAGSRIAQVVHVPGSQIVLLTARKAVCAKQWETIKVPTNLSVAIPNGHMGLITPWNDTVISGGVIDAGFRGEMDVLIMACSIRGLTYRKEDIIARLNILPLSDAEVMPGDLPDGERGDKGFGSTGM